jgi:hypothetical protein
MVEELGSVKLLPEVVKDDLELDELAVIKEWNLLKLGPSGFTDNAQKPHEFEHVDIIIV